MTNIARRAPLALILPVLALILSVPGLLFAACTAAPYRDAAAVVFSEDGATSDSPGAAVSTEGGGVSVTITSGGTYRLSGACRSGSVVVDCADGVVLLLDGVVLTNPAGSCVASVGEGELTLYALSGTESTLTDGTGYVFPDAVTDEPDAVVYAKSDLVLAGDDDGICHLVAYYKLGAATKDDLSVTGGNYTVSSIRHGIRGRDSVSVTGGSLAIEAAEDGIRTTNDKPGKEGKVAISGGSISVTAGDEAIQSISDVLISGGSLTIDSTNNGIKSDIGSLRVTGGSLSLNAPDKPIIAAAISHLGGDFTVNGLAYGD